ncbi:FAD-dependent oxidoreductase [Bengtsoniella intestinalis]|uniref:NAD(P)/FAD-dependent oxidoreductase n=1 Tax=Bengtsoniella intestinalis TaxID=3073143 RepID=UPI00391F2553
MKHIDLVIVGGGPAGLAAAIAAREAGCENLLVIERERVLGGILNQCIHNGFGLHTFKEELTGPEYAQRFIDKAVALDISVMTDSMVLSITDKRVVTVVNSQEGLFEIQAGAIVLAMGCRERSRGALNIPGHRPAGVYAAGTAQRLVNMEGYLPGRNVVILGSGDIGLIMARRMTLEGAKVHVVAELMPFSGGLKRNIVQCLDDFGIPLELSTTVVDIHGKDRLTGVTLAKVDDKMRPIAGTEMYYQCDTLLLSVGLVPENELSLGAGIALSPVHNGPIVTDQLATNVAGIFACGNVLHVHDLVDFVSQEAAQAGQHAVAYLQGAVAGETTVPLVAKGGVRYTVPATICPQTMTEDVTVRFRVGQVYQKAAIAVYAGERLLSRRKKKIMTPGEMEEVVLKKADLQGATAVTITIEQEKEGTA